MHLSCHPSWQRLWAAAGGSCPVPTLVLPFPAAGFSSWRCLPTAIFGTKTALLCFMVKNRNRLCPNVFVQRRKRHSSVIKDLLFPKWALRQSVPTTVLWILPQTQHGFPNAGAKGTILPPNSSTASTAAPWCCLSPPTGAHTFLSPLSQGLCHAFDR